MEEPQLPLLATNETLCSCSSLSISRWEVVVREIKKVSYIAMPMVVTAVSQNLLSVISMMMIGHLGELSLSSASIATSLANVTGFSLMVLLLSSSSFSYSVFLIYVETILEKDLKWITYYST